MALPTLTLIIQQYAIITSKKLRILKIKYLWVYSVDSKIKDSFLLAIDDFRSLRQFRFFVNRHRNRLFYAPNVRIKLNYCSFKVS